MLDTNDGTQRPGSEHPEPESVDRRLYGLVVLATVIGAGHHLDHVVRGNHVGWPLIPEVTMFTYTLLIYPLVAIGLYLTVTGRVGAAYWSVLLGGIHLLVTVTHFSPWATEPPRDVVGPHVNVYVGYFALAILLALVGSLVVTAMYSVHRWR